MGSVSDLEAQGWVLDEKDRNHLSLKDENYKVHTWENLKQTIGMALSSTEL